MSELVRLSDDEDRLPWLESVDTERAPAGVGAGRLIAAVLVALVAIGLVVGGLFWIRQRSQPALVAGGGDLIPAPPGPYKVVPKDAGGMAVAGEGDATFAASQGAQVDAAIDVSKQPEAPMAGNARVAEPARTPPVVVASGASAVTPAAGVVTPPTVAPATPAAAPVAPAPGTAVQLGAFGSEAKAQAAWKSLTGRFPALRPLAHNVTLTKVDGKRFYRLRVAAETGERASGLCHTLGRAKEACTIIG